MLLIPCPWCGPRDETEFVYGEAAIQRPADPHALSDAEWTEHLYFRDNPKGDHREFWFHRVGCHRWFVLERNTVTHAIAGAWPPGEAPPRRKDKA